MRTRIAAVAICFGIMLSAMPLAAHHSFSEYDKTKTVTIKGVVSKVEWANPHVRIYVDTKDANGTVTTWNFEMASTVALRRGGWSRNSLPVGTEVTMTGSASREGKPRAIGESVVKADGTAMFVGSSDK